MFDSCEVEKLIEYLPHRSPMIWVDRVSVSGSVNVAWVKLKSDALYFIKGEVIRGAFVEWMAQGYGYAEALRAISSKYDKNRKLEKAYLASVTGLNISEDMGKLEVGMELKIETECVRELLPIRIIKGRVFLENDMKVLAEANLKLLGVPV